MYGVLEDGFKENMTETEALKLAARALHASGQRDAASGNGMDLAAAAVPDDAVPERTALQREGADAA